MRLLLVVALALPLSPVDQEASYYVDPVGGVDAPLPHGTDPDRPWKTVAWASGQIRAAHPVSQAGVELNLRSGVPHPPAAIDRLKGTAERPFVIRPYGGSTITFDGSEPALRQPGAWVEVPGRPHEWVSRDTFTTLPNERIALGRMVDSRHLLIAYAELADLRAASESYARGAARRSEAGTGPGTGPGRQRHAVQDPFVYLGPGTHFEWLNSERTGLKGPEHQSGRDPTPELHVYQNTVVSSHPDDNGSFVGLTFAGMLATSKPRTYHNNIHLVLNLDRTLLPVPELPQAVAAGNIWHRFHPRNEPFFQAPAYHGVKKYWTLDELHSDLPDWERDSQHVDPRLVNFSDEYFERQVEYPNTDYRPVAGRPGRQPWRSTRPQLA